MQNKKQANPIILFDNNAHTNPSDIVLKTSNDWSNCFNPSSDSKIAIPGKKMIEKVTDDILSQCDVSTATHTVLYMSCGSESNNFIITSCFRAYKLKLIEKGSSLQPHIITSATEHSSIMHCLKDLELEEGVDITYITPTVYGSILPADVKAAIKPGTFLITIMFANNEIPVINNISEIGKIANEHNIPMHSDCVQVFGKYQISMIKNNLDALSASAHKFYGTYGSSILVLSNKLIEGYKLKAVIAGTQQHGLRAGTENVPAIASFGVALRCAFIDRKKKNIKLMNLRTHLLEKLKQNFIFADYTSYLVENGKHEPLELVSLGPPENKPAFILPNTVLLAVVKNIKKPFCNILLKKYLDERNIVVSIGSACNTNSKFSSHVLDAISAPDVIKRGVIRISFGDKNTIKEVDYFVKVFIEAVKAQTNDIKQLLTESYNKINDMKKK